MLDNIEESDNQSEKHLFKQPGIGTTEYSKLYEGQSHPQLCYHIQREHIVKAFVNNAIIIGFSIKSSQNQHLNCIVNVGGGSSCDVITRISKWPIFGVL